MPIAHSVRLDPDSRLAGIVKTSGANGAEIPVNSSHHQAADKVGKGLRVVGRCPDDDIIEALEGTTPDHFVVAVQWHPERSTDESSRAIFRALVDAASAKRK